MIYCRQISTGKFIEGQSSAAAGTLIKNALAAGFQLNDVEEVTVSDAEFKVIVTAANPAPPDKSDLANSDKVLQAACIYLGQLLGKTPAQLKAGIKAVYQSLP